MRSAISASIANHDFLRRSRRHREWLHFSIAGPEVDIVVNLSFVDDPASAIERAQLTLLVHRDGAWDGDVEVIDPEQLELRGGDVFAAWGRNRVEWRGGAFTIDVKLTSRPVAVALTIYPRSFPSMATNARIGGGVINWLVVPRSSASGSVAIGDRIESFVNVPAYHDHNWGRFEGGDVVWQWGHALSAATTSSVVLARLSDPVEATVYSQVLMLWDGIRPSRVFRGTDLELEREGLLRPARVVVVPRVATAIARAPTDVPRRLHLRARGDGDEVRGVFEAEDVARIVVPDARGLRSTAIHEVVGRFQLAGHVRGVAIEVASRAIFEFVQRLA